MASTPAAEAAPAHMTRAYRGMSRKRPRASRLRGRPPAGGGGVRVGDHVAVGAPDDGLLEIALGVLGEDRVHPDPALPAAEVERLEPAPHDGARGRLTLRRHGGP